MLAACRMCEVKPFMTEIVTDPWMASVVKARELSLTDEMRARAAEKLLKDLADSSVLTHSTRPSRRTVRQVTPLTLFNRQRRTRSLEAYKTCCDPSNLERGDC
jgi:hypothetical protein